MSVPQTSSDIPFAYRLFLLYIEPLFALNGSYLLFFNPAMFVKTFSPYLRFHQSSQILADQLGAVYLLFAWNEAVVLRIAKDIRVWKAIVLGILLCDLVHFWAGMKVMVEDGTVHPSTWRPEDWVAVLLLVIPGIMRVAFLCNVGLDKQKGRNKSVGAQKMS